jgi:hypothetical protein
MSLVVAIKNRSAVVAATDVPPEARDERYGPLMLLSNGSVLLIAGNLAAMRHVVMDVVLPKITREQSAAAVAQILQAALVLEVVPRLPELKGRVEFVVVGIDPIRHTEEPSIYYMDSAQDFYLRVVQADAIAGGATASVANLLAGHSFQDSSIEQLKLLAKECISSTKLRWPGALANGVRLAIITPHRTQLMDF